MYIFLPDEQNGLSQMESKLTAEKVPYLNANLLVDKYIELYFCDM